MAELIKIFFSSFDYPYNENLQIPKHLIQLWVTREAILKQIFDFAFSCVFVLFFSPLYIIISICIKLTSKGSIIYQQERIGKGGKPFLIYKFRSMVQNAEKNGPALSSRNDKRVTKLGKFLRKTRLDETPQFINVLKGDMSIVGPRPERKFYIDKILKKAPEYNLLLNVKPGITSLGQVKFGYASDVNQMLKRLRFDLVYIKHKTLLLDFKILYLTILVLLKGNGV